MLLDSDPSLVPCTGCGAPEAVGCFTGRPFPCFERRLAVANLDRQIALAFVPPDIPDVAWQMIVDAIVERQRGPSGLPVEGGVLHILGAEGGFRISTAYFQLRSGSSPLIARGEMIRHPMGTGFNRVFDAVDAYFALHPVSRSAAKRGRRQRRDNGEDLRVGLTVTRVPRSDQRFFRERLATTSATATLADSIAQRMFSSWPSEFE